jgi:hypothetical protein
VIHPRRSHSVEARRGLTLLELLLAATITAMVGAAIAAMLGAVSAGVGTRRDTRSVMVHAAAARTRLCAYIAPARCILAASGGNLTVWFDDSRTSGTVHASEIRWMIYDSSVHTLSVSYVKFPSGWTQIAKDLEDLEYPKTTDWNTVLDTYTKNGYIATLTLVDNVGAISMQLDNADVFAARHIEFSVGFITEDATRTILLPSTIEMHNAPTS